MDGVGRGEDLRVVEGIDADVTGSVEDDSSHQLSPSGSVWNCFFATVIADMAFGQPV